MKTKINFDSENINSVISPFQIFRIPETILRTLSDPFTYNPIDNPFTLFGFLWGLPIPVFFLLFHQRITDIPIRNLILNHPIHWAFLIHPIIFAIFFGIMGQIYTEYSRKLQFKATHDNLTGLLNHSVFQDLGKSRLKNHRNRNDPFSIVMFDLDNFKKINDTKGHQEGDQVLKEISNLLKKETRDDDHLGRYGGEEFIVAFPQTSSSEAQEIANRIRREIASEWNKIPENLTISGGVASYPVDGEHLDEMISMADRCLYKAKEEGRNRIVNSSQLIH